MGDYLKNHLSLLGRDRGSQKIIDLNFDPSRYLYKNVFWLDRSRIREGKKHLRPYFFPLFEHLQRLLLDWKLLKMDRVFLCSDGFSLIFVQCGDDFYRSSHIEYRDHFRLRYHHSPYSKLNFYRYCKGSDICFIWSIKKPCLSLSLFVFGAYAPALGSVLWGNGLNPVF